MCETMCIRALCFFTVIFISLIHITKAQNVELSNQQLLLAIQSLETNFNDKLNRIDSTLSKVQNDIYEVKLYIGPINDELRAITGRSSQGQQASEQTLTELNSLKVTMSEEIETLKLNIESLVSSNEIYLNYKFNETDAKLEDIQNLYNNSIEEITETIGQLHNYTKEEITETIGQVHNNTIEQITETIGQVHNNTIEQITETIGQLQNNTIQEITETIGQLQNNTIQEITETIGQSQSSLATSIKVIMNNHDTSVKAGLNTHDVSVKSSLDTHEESVKSILDTHDESVKSSLDTHDDSVKSSLDTHDDSVKSNLNTHDDSVKSSLNIHDDSVKSSLGSHDGSVKGSLKTHDGSVKTNIANIQKTMERCPEGGHHGFFMSPGSNQCFKAFINQARTWTNAKAKCKAEGLVLAKPYNAVMLRKYLLERYGTWSYWVDARGDGNTMRWQTDRYGDEKLWNNDRLWYPGQPGSKLSSQHCLLLLANPTNTKQSPEQPYYSTKCSGTTWTLCERIME